MLLLATSGRGLRPRYVWKANEGKRATESGIRDSYSRHVDGTFIQSVHPQESIGLVVVDSPDLTAAQPQGHRGQGHALGDMACVQIEVTLGSLFVLPLAALENGCPNQNQACFVGNLLI